MINSVPVLDTAVRERAPAKETTSERNPADVVRVGVIGYGYWGPNIVRNLSGLENCELAAVCDKSPVALKRMTRAYPGVLATTDFTEVLRSPDIDAVAVLTDDLGPSFIGSGLTTTQPSGNTTRTKVGLRNNGPEPWKNPSAFFRPPAVPRMIGSSE